jgi:GTP-binding protein
MVRHRVEWERAVHTQNQFPASDWPQVGFAGRSNVGKSSLLNGLFGIKLAGVSQTPGKTRSLNFYRVDDAFFLVDLPGYGYAKTSQSDRGRFRTLTGHFLEQNANLAGVVQLVDLRHDPTALDLTVAEYLGALGPPHLIVLTKADKLSRGAGLRQRDAAAAQMKREPDELVLFSCVDGRGASEIWKWILAHTRGVKDHA